MGDGAFGSNGSVHWRVNDATTPIKNGADTSKRHPEPPSTVAPDSGPVIGAPGHAGTFRVTARYPTAQAAAQALADLNARYQNGGGSDLVLFVNVRPYVNPVGPETDWEVTVDW